MEFKVLFPGGYRVEDELNDNLDIHVIIPDGKVFFATLFTVANIKHLMLKDKATYFWAVDMLIISDLRKHTIDTAIRKAVDDGYLERAFDTIGTITEVYGQYSSYEELPCEVLRVVE